MDIVWQADDGTVSFWLLNGVTTGGEVTCVPNPGTAWQVVGVGDFNHNGCSDVLFQKSDGTLGMWVMMPLDPGDQSTWGPAINAGVDPQTGITSVGSGDPVVGVGDFNGDGKSDIVTQAANIGAISILTMNGSSITGTTTVTPPSSGWQVVGVGDFNGDGLADIAIRHTSGTVAIVLTGANTILAGVNPGVMDWTVAAIGDLDGDGKAEIIWRTGTLQNANGSWLPAVWFIQSTPVAPALVHTWCGFGLMPLATKIYAAVDFDKDGKADLLFQDQDTSIIIVTMNGASAIQFYNFGPHQDSSHGTAHVKGTGMFYKVTVQLIQ